MRGRQHTGAQRLREVVRLLKAMLGVLFEQPHDDGRQIGGHIGATLHNGHRRFGQMLHEQRRRGPPHKRRLAAEHLVRHDAERIEIAAGIEIAITRRLLGAHVCRRPDRHAGGRQARLFSTVGRGACNTEVGHERAPVDPVEQNVVGLDVPVHDPARMRVGQGIRHFQQPAAHVVHRQRPTLLHQRGEVVAIDARHHEEHEVPDFVDRIDGDDVRMAQLRGGLRFAQKARAHIAPERQLGWQQLDGDKALEPAVLGAIHDSHSATADFLVELVGSAERLLYVCT